MNAIDWTDMLTDLEQKKTGLEQELADVEAVIDAVKQRSAPKVNIRDTTAPRANGSKGTRTAKAKPIAKATRQGLTDDQRATAKKQWESNVPADTIAARLKIKVPALYYYVKTGGWKRPNPGAAASPAAAAPTERMAEKLAGSVKCTNPDCGVMTDFDPCRRCGQKLKRAKW